jgi:hypothetical protein
MIKNARTSDLTGWERFSAKGVITFLSGRFIAPVNVSAASQAADIKIESDVKTLNEEQFIQNMNDLRAYVLRHVAQKTDIDQSLINDSVTSIMTQIFMSGSHIHQNAATLIYLGLPIIKLDGLYRGMFNIYDVQRISQQLPTHEAEALQRLLLERPYGGSTLIGWKRAAFMVGLI